MEGEKSVTRGGRPKKKRTEDVDGRVDGETVKDGRDPGSRHH